MKLLVVFLIGLILYQLWSIFRFWLTSVVMLLWLEEHGLSMPPEADMKRLTDDALKNLIKYGW